MLTPSLVTPAMLLVGPLGFAVGSAVFLAGPVRSEERRVGKEC